MQDWHSKTCRRPHIEVAGGTPFCASCGSFPPDIEDSTDESPIPPLPKPAPRSRMNLLYWPPSVQYAKRIVLDGDSGDITEYVQENIDRWASEAANPSRVNSGLSNGPNGASGAGDASSISEALEESPDGGEGPASSLPHYSRLLGGDKFRMLRLFKGSPTDPIHCALLDADLGGHLPYEALSYTWANEVGDNRRTGTVYVGARWSSFRVTENCEAALRVLRYDDADRLVWVDAICIDQANVAERTHQVGLMKRIYERAFRVLVYLGGEVRSPDGSTVQQRLVRILDHPYFSRIWVIQEVASASAATILYRPAHLNLDAHDCMDIDWTDFCDELRRMRQDGDSASGSAALSVDIRHPWVLQVSRPRAFRGQELLPLLEDTKASLASDPRDKVFALLGLVASSSPPLLPPPMDNHRSATPDSTASVASVSTSASASIPPLLPDYALSFAALQTGLALHYMQLNPNRTNTSLLGWRSKPSASSPHKRRAGLPSWVPDLSDRLVALEDKVGEIDPLVTPRMAEATVQVHAGTGALVLDALEMCTVGEAKIRGLVEGWEEGARAEEEVGGTGHGWKTLLEAVAGPPREVQDPALNPLRVPPEAPWWKLRLVLDGEEQEEDADVLVAVGGLNSVLILRPVEPHSFASETALAPPPPVYSLVAHALLTSDFVRAGWYPNELIWVVGLWMLLISHHEEYVGTGALAELYTAWINLGTGGAAPWARFGSIGLKFIREIIAQEKYLSQIQAACDLCRAAVQTDVAGLQLLLDGVELYRYLSLHDEEDWTFDAFFESIAGREYRIGDSQIDSRQALSWLESTGLVSLDLQARKALLHGSLQKLRQPDTRTIGALVDLLKRVRVRYEPSGVVFLTLYIFAMFIFWSGNFTYTVSIVIVVAAVILFDMKRRKGRIISVREPDYAEALRKVLNQGFESQLDVARFRPHVWYYSALLNDADVRSTWQEPLVASRAILTPQNPWSVRDGQEEKALSKGLVIWRKRMKDVLATEGLIKEYGELEGGKTVRKIAIV